MSAAKQTLARLVDQRARRRAAQLLIEAHRDEYQTLYTQAHHLALAEAQALAAKAPETPTPEPPRLMTGRRKADEDVMDRIDVARCPHCIGHHDRGHACTHCGTRPGGLVAPDAVRSLARQGLDAQAIATVTGLTTATVRRVLEHRVASA